jgi:hypothetical protein
MADAEQLEGAVIREDGVRSSCRGDEYRIGFEPCGRGARRNDRVDAAGCAGDATTGEVVPEALHGATATTRRCEGSGGLVEREYGVRSEELCGAHLTSRRIIGNKTTFSSAKRQVD